MIPTTLEKHIFTHTAAPKTITSDAQLEEYVTALLEMDLQTELTAAERNFAELLIMLIEAYVEKHDFVTSASLLERLQESWSANDSWQNN